MTGLLLGDIGKMVKDLSEIILADGTISQDERALMYSVNQDIVRFSRALAEALRDNIVTEAETQQLTRLWKEINEHAQQTALKDQIITPEERQILIRIAETITKRLNE